MLTRRAKEEAVTGGLPLRCGCPRNPCLTDQQLTSSIFQFPLNGLAAYVYFSTVLWLPPIAVPAGKKPRGEVVPCPHVTGIPPSLQAWLHKCLNLSVGLRLNTFHRFFYSSFSGLTHFHRLRVLLHVCLCWQKKLICC